MKLLIRLDDACPTMKQDNWNRIEKILDDYNIKAIVAVIPDCKDPNLRFDEHDRNFWDRVIDWQNKGWTIAQHGYQHVYHRVDKRKNILKIHNFSEFTELPLEEQKQKIKKGYELMKNRGINPNVFIAPAHAFDLNTLKALKEMTDIKIIGDGYAYDIYYYKGFFWIPQILGAVRERWLKILEFLKFKVVTIALHPNVMSSKEIDRFDNFIKRNFSIISSIQEFFLIKRVRTCREKYFEKVFTKIKYDFLTKKP